MREADPDLLTQFADLLDDATAIARKAISLDGATIAEMLAAPSPADEAFDREWWATMLQTALDRWAEEDSNRHRILRLHKSEGKSHAEIARVVSSTPAHVNNEVRAAKKRVREILLAQVENYCSSPSEVAEEVARLRRQLS